MTGRVHRSLATALVGVLVAGGCTDGTQGDVPQRGDGRDADAVGESGPSEAIRTDVGVTEEPCPDAVDPERGCIYLGVLSDLTEGPFASLAVAVTEGQRAFWRRVNEDGGIGGYEIDIDTYTLDTRYDPDRHLEGYLEIEPEVLALAQTFGTSTTRAIVAEMDDADVIGIPVSWWSGWGFEQEDAGVILESGYSYCLEPMIALDWLTTERDQPATVLVVGFPDAYGADVAAGVQEWAGVNDAEYLGFVETSPNAEIGSQDAVVEAVVEADADVVYLAVSPTETAEIVGDAAGRDYVGQFVGSAPTYDPVLLESPAAEALEALYLHVGPWSGYDGGEAGAHEAMRESLAGGTPTNDGFTAGWVLSYPLEAALRAGVERGDLTREGLRGAASELEVDYQDALPVSTVAGGAADARSATISVPSDDAPLGLSLLETGVTGPTADAYDSTAPCS